MIRTPLASPLALRLALLLAAAGGAAAQSPDLFQAESLPLDGILGSIHLADLDGGGAPDLIGLHRASGGDRTIAVYPGDGAGGFGAAAHFDVPDTAEGCLLADVDGDGNADVLTWNEDSESVSVLLGDGAGAFGTAVEHGVGGEPLSIFVADLDLDGAPDVLTSTRTSPTTRGFSILPGDGLGGFGPVEFHASTFPSSDAVAAQLDGVLGLDVVLRGSSGIHVFAADGPGLFDPEVFYPTSSTGDLLSLADLDADGNLDAVVFPGGEVLLGQGGGVFGPSSPAPVTGPSTTADGLVIDLDGNGDLDLVLGSTVLDLALLDGDGAGGFAAPELVFQGRAALSVAAADLNGDTWTDVVTTDGEALVVHLATAPGSFPAPVRSPDEPSAFALGDVDGDGSVDLVGLTGEGLEFRAGDGTGGFAPAAAAAGPSTLATDAVLADLDGDGEADLVATVGTPADEVRVWLGDGSGGFAHAGSHATDPNPLALEVGDVDGDGFLDLVTINALSVIFPPGSPSTSSMTWLLGDGAGGLGPFAKLDLPQFPAGLALADVGGSPLPDAVLSLRTLDMGGIALNTGGAFAVPTLLDVGGRPAAVAVADVDDDGLDDLLFAKTGPTTLVPPALAVLRGLGGGAFAAAESYDTSGYASALVATDVDGDGRVDAVLGGVNADDTVVLLGDGSGGFGAARQFPEGAGLAVADVDADGWNELVIGRGGELFTIDELHAATPGTVVHGIGTPGCMGTQTMVAGSAPQIGNADFGMVVSGAPPAGFGAFFMASAVDSAGTVYLGDLLFHVDFFTTTFLFWAGLASDAGGTGTLPLPLPADPTLAGGVFVFQSFWAWPADAACDPSSTGLSSSRALVITLLP